MSPSALQCSRATRASFLVSVLPCAGPGDAAQLRKYVTTYANSPAQFKFNNKVFVSTFAGEKCTFGQANAAQGWKSQFTSQLSGANAVFFVPSFFVDPGQFGDYASAVDGMFNVRSVSHLLVNKSSYALTGMLSVECRLANHGYG